MSRWAWSWSLVGCLRYAPAFCVACVGTSDEAGRSLPTPAPGSDWVNGTAPVPAAPLGVPAISDDWSPAAPPPPAHCEVAPRLTAVLPLTTVVVRGTPVAEWLPDGRLLVVHEEDDDRFTTHRIMAQVIDVDAGVVVSTDQLDDGFATVGAATLIRVEGAIVLTYQRISGTGLFETKVRIFVGGRWSKESFSSNGMGVLGRLPDGSIYFVESATSFPGEPTLVIWSPAGGWWRWRWPLPSKASLRGARLLADGRFFTVVADLDGAIFVQVRDRSGVWVESPKEPPTSEATILDDGTVVFAWAEIDGEVQKTRAQTWTTDGVVSAIETLSVAPDGSEAVSPAIDPTVAVLARSSVVVALDARTAEYSGWVGHCGASDDPAACTYSPVSRRYREGKWSAPIDLSFGSPARRDELSAESSGTTTILARFGEEAAIRVRFGDGEFSTPMLLGDPSARPWWQLMVGERGVWALRGSAGASPHVAWFDVLGPASPAVWYVLPVTRGSAAGPIGSALSYVDQTGSLVVGLSAAPTAGATPFVARTPPSAEPPDLLAVQHDDERNGTVTWGAPAPGAASALYVARVLPKTPVGGRARLRTHVWNQAGSLEVVIAEPARGSTWAKPLPNACGGVVLYTAEQDGASDRRLVLEAAIMR